MKNFAKTFKTAMAGLAASALIPFGMMTASAVDSVNTEYATVHGAGCYLKIDGVMQNALENYSSDPNLLIVPVDSGSEVYAYCLNGEGEVPLTVDPGSIAVDFFTDPTPVSDMVEVDRLVSDSADNFHKDVTVNDDVKKDEAKDDVKVDDNTTTTDTTTVKAPATDTVKPKVAPTKATPKPALKAQSTPKRVVRNDGKVATPTTPSVIEYNQPAASQPTDSGQGAAVVDENGTADDVVSAEDTPAEVDNDGVETVQSSTIDAGNYAAANISAVDQMGGAGTLVGIVMLGLIGAAGAISLTRSIILG